MGKTMRMILLLSSGLPTLVLAADETQSADTDPVLEQQAAAASAAQEGMLTRLWQSMQPGPDDRPLPGDDSSAWLSLQASGVQASGNPQPVSMTYRERAARRFMKTLDQDIPVMKSDSGFKSNK